LIAKNTYISPIDVSFHLANLECSEKVCCCAYQLVSNTIFPMRFGVMNASKKSNTGEFSFNLNLILHSVFQPKILDFMKVK